MEWTTGLFTLDIGSGDGLVRALRFAQAELVAASAQAPLFTFVALDADRRRVTMTPENGRIEADTLVFTNMRSCRGSHPITAALRGETADGVLTFSLHVESRDSEYTIVETVWALSCLRLGDTEDTQLLYPHHAGEKIVNPVYTLRSERYQNFWRAATALRDGEWVRECNYCGLCSMTWMYLQNTDTGLYIASHDDRFPVTGLLVKTGGEEEKYLSLGFRIHKRIPAGESWSSGGLAISVTRKDWHYGAKLYRAWIDPHLPKIPQPAFLKQEAALNQCYNFKREEGVLNRFSDIPRMWEEGNKRGIRHMFIASWNRTGFDSNYPEYYPDMELGTALDFKRGIDYVRAHGGFSTLYVNARLSDQASDFHKTLLSRMQIENEAGKPYTETYGPRTFTLNCPSDAQWQHMLVDTCDFAAQAYGFKGIYLDQLASAEPFACYHGGHTHEDIGDFNRGYLAVLDELLQRLRRRDKDAYLMTENCGDIYSAYTWGSLTWNGTQYDEYYPLFRYTFPEYTQVNMCNHRMWIEDPAEREDFFFRDIQRCVLLGNILWIGITSRFLHHDELEEDFSYLLQAVAFRESIARQVANGRYADDFYVADCPDGICASCFDVSERELLLLVGSHRKTGGTVTFRLPYERANIRAFDESGTRVSCRVRNRLLAVSLTGQRLVRITVRQRKD